MHYSLGKGIVIKSENAAKPGMQASRPLSEYISRLDDVASSFDYGCGKLRYAKSILKTTEMLTVVDSEIQIGRTQTIQGQSTNIRDVARRSNRMQAANVLEFSKDRQKFDRGFCINVLSVIPFYSARRDVVSLMRQKLRPGGTCLFVVQYRNSDFNRMGKLPNARPWRDGILIDSLRGFSFYGLISPKRLIVLVINAGFEVVDEHLDDGRVFLMARSPRRALTEIEVVSEMNFATRVIA
jgi:SAM-dependent methyltransferase